MHKTIYNPDYKISQDDLKFEYQKNLTKKLDSITDDFNQNILNKIYNYEKWIRQNGLHRIYWLPK